MVDGLGKEISAGKEDNLRSVKLDVLYSDEYALVCVVPKRSDKSDDGDEDGIDTYNSGDEYGPLGENGKNVLLFLKEDDLDSKLEGLRAA
jgi:hypothetical protein